MFLKLETLSIFIIINGKRIIPTQTKKKDNDSLIFIITSLNNGRLQFFL